MLQIPQLDGHPKIPHHNYCVFLVNSLYFAGSASGAHSDKITRRYGCVFLSCFPCCAIDGFPETSDLLTELLSLLLGFHGHLSGPFHILLLLDFPDYPLHFATALRGLLQRELFGIQLHLFTPVFKLFEGLIVRLDELIYLLFTLFQTNQVVFNLLFFPLQIHQQLIYRFLVFANPLAGILQHCLGQAALYCNLKSVGTSRPANFQFVGWRQFFLVKMHGTIDQPLSLKGIDFQVAVVCCDNAKNFFFIELIQYRFCNSPPDQRICTRAEFVDKYEASRICLFDKQSSIAES